MPYAHETVHDKWCLHKRVWQKNETGLERRILLNTGKPPFKYLALNALACVQTPPSPSEKSGIESLSPRIFS